MLKAKFRLSFSLRLWILEIVEDQPASHPGIGETLPLRANHISIYKFESSDNEGYKFVKAKILQMMRGEVKESNDKGSTVFNNLDKVHNQAARDININSPVVFLV
ncbi:hypothetical protein QSH57_013525 [Fusarium oxysporum f. sp. vasinfectum]|nr:hypothetical protein QSH57_013525 [Fusarium oxysporum f. sp. vasinfectum]